MALELECVVVTNLIRVSYWCIAVTFTLAFLLNSCTQDARWSASVIKCAVCGLACIKVFERRAGLGYRYGCVNGFMLLVIEWYLRKNSKELKGTKE